MTRAIDYLCAHCTDDAFADLLLQYSRHWRNVLYNNHDRRRANWLASAVAAARRVGAQWDLANVLQAQGDVLAFLDERTEALGLFRAVGARLGEANVLQAQRDVALSQGDEAAGMALLAQARERYEAVGSRVGLANVGIRLARYAAGKGAYGAAITYMQPAADFCFAINHPLGPALQAEIADWQTKLNP